MEQHWIGFWTKGVRIWKYAFPLPLSCEWKKDKEIGKMKVKKRKVGFSWEEADLWGRWRLVTVIFGCSIFETFGGFRLNIFTLINTPLITPQFFPHLEPDNANLHSLCCRSPPVSFSPGFWSGEESFSSTGCTWISLIFVGAAWRHGCIGLSGVSAVQGSSHAFERRMGGDLTQGREGAGLELWQIGFGLLAKNNREYRIECIFCRWMRTQS